MKVYAVIVTCAFFLLTAFFVWKSLEAYRSAASAEDQKQRRKARRSALLLLLPGVMFLSAALFILTRIGVFLYVSYMIGMLAVAAALGPGLRDNMWKHGGN